MLDFNASMKKKIAILGSTGSIGRSTLQVIRHLKDQFSVVAIAAKENIDLLEIQAKEFGVHHIAVHDQKKAIELQKRLPECRVVSGMEGILETAAHPEADMVVSALVGAAGILPTIKAIESKKAIGLANKESLVVAGEYIKKLAKKNNVQIMPIDSEHNAIFQCLAGEDKANVSRLILTASGGPFRLKNQSELDAITPSDALKHPTWDMGAKVTIDCSTLMNKGIEVIEAHVLFDIPLDQIDVVIHPQSLVHSFVEFCDGSLKAQISEPEMIIPIQYALTYPKREKGIVSCFDFTKYSKLEFFAPDTAKFPCLDLAYEAAYQGGTMPCYMNAANEVLVSRFLEGDILWKEIGTKLEKLMNRHQSQKDVDLETIFAIDASAREEAKSV